jgi:flagellin-like hook-associated protein FlgL
MINNSGLNLIAGIDPATNGIILTAMGGAGQITVSEGASGSAAEDLGILGSGRDIHGGDLCPVLGEDTLLSDVDALNGITLDSFNVTMGGESYEVDFNTPSYPSTVGDLLERISAAVPGLEAEMNDTADGIIMLSENAFSVEENGATTAADLGFAGGSHEIQPYGLFGTLNNFRQALENNDTEGIEDVIGELEQIKDGVLEIEAAVGSRAKQGEIVKSQLADSRIRLVENLSLVEDVNIAEVLTNLSKAQLVYQAALKTASSIYDVSLLNYVR